MVAKKLTSVVAKVGMLWYACIGGLTHGRWWRLLLFAAGAPPYWVHALRRPLPAAMFRASRRDSPCDVNECEPVFASIDIGLWSNHDGSERIESSQRIRTPPRWIRYNHLTIKCSVVRFTLRGFQIVAWQQ